MKKLLFALLFVLAFGVSTALADSRVTFEWDANIEADLAGYRIYQANESGGHVFDPNLAVATVSAGTETATIQLLDGTYYWVLVSYDTSGNESGPTAEVTETLDSEAPAVPTGWKVTIIIRIEPQ